jgi:hypothetical protein
VIVYATTFSRTLQTSELSRAIFLNQLRYLPRYILEQVKFLNAWRAGRKLGAILICYYFSKLSKKSSTEVRIDSPSQGADTAASITQLLSAMQISSFDHSENVRACERAVDE